MTTCDRNEAWKFSRKSKDPCEDYDVISDKPWKYDVNKTTGWKSWNSAPFMNFHLECNNCSSGKKGAYPEEKGKYVDNVCVCEEGFLGITTRFQPPLVNILRWNRHMGNIGRFQSEAGTYHLQSNPFG